MLTQLFLFSNIFRDLGTIPKSSLSFLFCIVTSISFMPSLWAAEIVQNILYLNFFEIFNNLSNKFQMNTKKLLLARESKISMGYFG